MSWIQLAFRPFVRLLLMSAPRFFFPAFFFTTSWICRKWYAGYLLKLAGEGQMPVSLPKGRRRGHLDRLAGCKARNSSHHRHCMQILSRTSITASCPSSSFTFTVRTTYMLSHVAPPIQPAEQVWTQICATVPGLKKSQLSPDESSILRWVFLSCISQAWTHWGRFQQRMRAG